LVTPHGTKDYCLVPVGIFNWDKRCRLRSFSSSHLTPLPLPTSPPSPFTLKLSPRVPLPPSLPGAGWGRRDSAACPGEPPPGGGGDERRRRPTTRCRRTARRATARRGRGLATRGGRGREPASNNCRRHARPRHRVHERPSSWAGEPPCCGLARLGCELRPSIGGGDARASEVKDGRMFCL